MNSTESNFFEKSLHNSELSNRFSNSDVVIPPNNPEKQFIGESTQRYPKKRSRDCNTKNGWVNDNGGNKNCFHMNIETNKRCFVLSGKKKRCNEMERNPAVLARRQKQIDYGKNTLGYDRYVQAVPKNSRKKHHPSTPPKHYKYSRRAWDGLVKIWRQQLHFWDNTEHADNSKKKSSDNFEAD